MKLDYPSYLQLERLLDLQQPRSEPAEHDELLFIVIHQVYELWFKETLHELDKVKRDFSANDLFGALGTLKRIRMIIKTLVGQLDVLETMTPLSFVAFRDRLDSASGFQSAQFREIEFTLGYKRPEMLRHLDSEWPGTARARARLEQPSLVDHFYEFLEHRGVEIPDELKQREPTAGNEPNEVVQRGVLRLYKEQAEVTLLFELMMDIVGRKPPRNS